MNILSSPLRTTTSNISYNSPLSNSPLGSYKVRRGKEKRRIIKNDENRCITSSASNIFTQISTNSPNPDAKKAAKFAANKIEFSKKAIKDHIERKLQLYLLIAAATYNTPNNYYEIGTTDAQGPSSRKIVVRSDKGNYSQKAHSVHSSPMPAITVCLRKSYDDYQQNVITESDLVRYKLFYNSEFHFKQNSTEPLPDFINRGDSLLEGKRDDGKLRDQTIKLINDLAMVKLNFSEGLVRFLTEYETIVDSTLAHINATTKDATDIKVLTIFKRHIHYLFEKTGDYKFEDQFFGINTQEIPDEIRQELYKERAAEMQNRFLHQSEVAKGISPIRKKGPRGKKAKPHDYEKVVMLRTLERVTEPDELLQLQKLLCLTKEELESLTKDLDPAKKLFDSKEYTEEFKVLDARLKASVQAELENDLAFQAKALDTLMVGTGLDADGLIEIYNGMYQDDQITKTDIDNILNKVEMLTLKRAKNLADIFLTTPGIFFRNSV